MTLRSVLSWVLEAVAAAIVFSLFVAALSGCRPELRTIRFDDGFDEPTPANDNNVPTNDVTKMTVRFVTALNGLAEYPLRDNVVDVRIPQRDTMPRLLVSVHPNFVIVGKVIDTYPYWKQLNSISYADIIAHRNPVSKPIPTPSPDATLPLPSIQLPAIDWPRAVACAFNVVDTLKMEIASAKPTEKRVMGQTRQLVAFTADWCAPCRKMHSVWAALRDEGFDVREVDVDRPPKEYKDFKPLRIPLTALFVDEKFAQQWVGVVEAKTLRSAMRDGTSTLPTSLGRVLLSPHAPELDVAAKESSDIQAERNQQGHHDWDRRKAAIIQTCGYRNVEEICAESWPAQKDADDLTLWTEAFKSWRQSDGHWQIADRVHAAYGRARSRGSDGVWFFTILAADGLARSEPLEQPVAHNDPLLLPALPAESDGGKSSQTQTIKPGEAGQPDAGCSGGL